MDKTLEKISADAVPEFSHIVPLSEIGSQVRRIKLAANDEQRAGLVMRFDLLSLSHLTAELSLWSDEESLWVEGQYKAEVEQSCVATGRAVAEKIAEHFKLRFVSEAQYAPDAEIELLEEDCDTIFHNGKIIDLGEAVAQSLGLALNPFPRSADADGALKQAGVLGEHQAGPFAALAALQKKQD